MDKREKITVAIIDYGMGNLFSIKQACEYVGLQPQVTSKAEEILKADCAILPGVGAFGDAVRNLKHLQLEGPIVNFIKSGKPFMGICLGMQLLFTESEEFGKHKGLDIIHGSVIRFPLMDKNGKKNKIPQVGWNRIYPDRNNSLWHNSPLSEITENSFMYFVHSYYCIPRDKRIVLSLTEYIDIEYCSSIMRKNVYASQFHPEKSAQDGLQIYRNWFKH